MPKFGLVEGEGPKRLMSMLGQDISEHTDPAAFYGRKWRFADDKAHAAEAEKAKVDADKAKVDNENGDEVNEGNNAGANTGEGGQSEGFDLSADNFDEETLKAMPYDQLRNLGASLGVVKLGVKKEKLIEQIREKTGR